MSIFKELCTTPNEFAFDSAVRLPGLRAPRRPTHFNFVDNAELLTAYANASC